MAVRRRPIASLLAALLAWTTVLSTVQVACPDDMRLAGVEASPSSTLIAGAAPAVAAAVRVPSRPSTIPQPDLPFAEPSPSLLRATPDRRESPLLLARVRRAHGLSSTYDAIAPPRGSA
jgi:hypothetical protein